MNPNHAQAGPSHLVEANFFDGAEALRTQVEQSCAGSLGDGSGPLRRVEERPTYSFLMATADCAFSLATALSLTARLRGWGLETLGLRHASTPQLHVYLDGCARALAADATPAAHHYLYSLSRPEPAQLQILDDGSGRKTWLGVRVRRLSGIRLGFNTLLVHPAKLAYAITGPRGAKSAPEGAVFLHGYLW